MANRTFYPAQNYGSSRVYAEFRITLGGAATSVSLATVDGSDIVASVTHVAATNKWTFTLKDAFNKVISHNAELVEVVAGGTGHYATMGNFANEGTRTPLQFDLFTYNNLGDALNDSARTVCITIAFRNGNWGVK
jgi:hypothetical protein